MRARGRTTSVSDMSEKAWAKAVTRREFLGRGAAAIGVGALGAVAAGGMKRPALAFPPDSWIEGFARMVFHENPIGPYPHVFEVLEEISRSGRSSGGVMAYPDFKKTDLEREILKEWSALNHELVKMQTQCQLDTHLGASGICSAGKLVRDLHDLANEIQAVASILCRRL